MPTYVYYINAHAKPNYLQTESTTPFQCCRCGNSVRKFSHKTSLVTSARSYVITGHMFRGGLREGRVLCYYCRDYYLSSRRH